jgi:hypothetical protein
VVAARDPSWVKLGPDTHFRRGHCFFRRQKEITGKLFEPPGDSPQSLKVCFDLTSTSVVHV